MVPVTTDAPSVTLTLKLPWGMGGTVNDTFTVPPETFALAVPVAPAPGLTLALYFPLPPLMRNENVAPAVEVLHAIVAPPIGYSAGFIARGTTGAAVPTTLSTVGGVSNVRPAESVIANVRPVKQMPFVMTVNAPPLVRTGTPANDTAVGKFVATMYGGVPPKM